MEENIGEVVPIFATGYSSDFQKGRFGVMSTCGYTKLPYREILVHVEVEDISAEYFLLQPFLLTTTMHHMLGHSLLDHDTPAGLHFLIFPSICLPLLC